MENTTFARLTKKKKKKKKKTFFKSQNQNLVLANNLFQVTCHCFFKPSNWIRNYVHFPNEQNPKLRGTTFLLNKMAALLGLINWSHEKLTRRASFIQNFSSLQNQDSTELTLENTFRIIVLKDFSLECTFCSAVELSHEKTKTTMHSPPI